MARNSFQWDDPFQLDQQLSEDERMIRDAAHAYCQEKLAPACWKCSATKSPT